MAETEEYGNQTILSLEKSIKKKKKRKKSIWKQQQKSNEKLTPVVIRPRMASEFPLHLPGIPT